MPIKPRECPNCNRDIESVGHVEGCGMARSMVPVRQARPWDNADPTMWPEELPHPFLPDGPDDTCQFTSGNARCRSTRAQHRATWPDLEH